LIFDLPKRRARVVQEAMKLAWIEAVEALSDILMAGSRGTPNVIAEIEILGGGRDCSK
jgi:hypothetical protein